MSIPESMSADNKNEDPDATNQPKEPSAPRKDHAIYPVINKATKELVPTAPHLINVPAKIDFDFNSWARWVVSKAEIANISQADMDTILIAIKEDRK